jgi:hypothetical protein
MGGHKSQMVAARLSCFTGRHRRAAVHGRSAEAEHRNILRQVLSEGSSDLPFGDLRGKIRIAPDFDQTPDDMIETMERGDA